jgi:hypothetical protein
MVFRDSVLSFVLLMLLFAPLPAQGGRATSGLAEVNGTQLYCEKVLLDSLR